MADKVQNITINYKVNTVEIEKAKNLSQQAQQATDKFHQSAQQGAAKSAQGLSTLTAEQTRLENAIKNTNRSAFTSYAAYTKQLQGLSRQYSDVKVKIEQATKAVNEQKKAQDELNKTTSKMNTAFGQLGTAISGVFSAITLRAVVNVTLEMAKLSGTIEGVERAFSRLPNSTLLLDQLRTATHGTVTDLELMQKSLSASNFKIPLESLGKLLEFAAVKAQQTGQEVNHLVDYIVSGIGLRSIKRLDDLGFTANRMKEALGGATLQAASMGQVMDAVTTLIDEDFKKTGGFVDTTATKVGQLTVEYEKLREVVSKKITQEGGLVDFFKDAVEATRLLVAGNGDVSKSLRLEGIREEAIELVKLFKEGLGKDTVKNLEDVQQKLNSTIQDIGRYNDLIRDTRQEIELMRGFGFPGFSEENQAGAKRYAELVAQYGNKAKEVFEKENEFARKRLIALLRNQEVLKSTIPILKEYLELLNTPPEVAESLGLIEQKMSEIEAKELEIKTAKSEGAILGLRGELEKLNGELADLNALGTTKRQLIVNGELRLVPVIAPKGESKTVAAKGTDMTAQLQPLVDEMMKGVSANLNLAPSGQVDIIPMDEWDRIGEEFANNWQDILGTGLADTTDFLGAVIQAEADSYDARIAQSRQYYDRLMVLAGDNEKQKDRLRLREQKEENRLRREAFEADKRAKAATAAINGAAGIVNAFATLPYPAALVATVLIAAQTAAQIAVINAQKPRFAKGVIDLQGPGTKTSVEDQKPDSPMN